ncbi:response regulator transcription factor [Paenibacillus pasadenensis]|uniref:Two-component response regulator yesN n=1 Tax=Paenibacillus pasadenensis TaxID=217090 RepID=A0A2N5N227_9BACL|nr:response regulator [Paenibacillus pasadenensis]PLT44373.1 Two-component response regulator yesN [Paenibacillus pasadenensis]
MTELLIVDDERFAVEGILACVDWQALGIERVHAALHADEAKSLLSERRVGILICDIEMPDEDGLSLVRWTKEHSPHTQTLFLTCHSEFSFAKQAMQLGSSDYLLKPVDSEELEQVVGRMLGTIREREEALLRDEQYRNDREWWRKQRPLLAERFWQDLLSRRILSFGDFLERSLKDAQLELAPSSRAMPILVSIEEWLKPLEGRDEDIMEYAVRKAAGEILLDGLDGHVAQDRSGVLIAIACSGEELAAERWRNAAYKLIAVCEAHFYCRASCYIGRFVPLPELPRCAEQLRGLERTRLGPKGSVVVYEPQPSRLPGGDHSDSLDAPLLASLLLAGDGAGASELILRSVEPLGASPALQLRQIERYCQDTLHAVYSFLQAKGIPAAAVPQFSLWESARIRSLTQYRSWAENIVFAVLEAAFSPKEEDGAVRKAVQFIHENVEEDISRDDVAAHVHLNPAYLSRLFKKQTGSSLIDCLIAAKLDRARQLLGDPSITVAAAAQQVGYSNFSHFTKMFKKQFGVNPQEYRMSRND